MANKKSASVLKRLLVLGLTLAMLFSVTATAFAVDEDEAAVSSAAAQSEETETPTEESQPAEAAPTEETPAEDIALTGEDDGIATASISGQTEVQVGSTITLSSNASEGYRSDCTWTSSDTSIATVTKNSSSRSDRATVTGVSTGKVTISHTYQVFNYSSWSYESKTETYTVTVVANTKTVNATAFYLKDPGKDPTSNDTGNWGDKGINYIVVKDPKGYSSKFTDGKNFIGTEVADYIVSWPDGSTGSTWTLDKNTYSSVYSSMANYYESYYRIDLSASDITSITLTPYKISKDNGTAANGAIGSSTTSQAVHVDCILTIVSPKLYTARFWVQQPGETNDELVCASNYQHTGSEKIQKLKDGANGNGKSYESSVPQYKTYNGELYVLDGWYNEAGDKVTDWPYGTPSAEERADGAVNFYAKYVKAEGAVTITKTVTGADPTADASKLEANGLIQYQIGSGAAQNAILTSGWTKSEGKDEWTATYTTAPITFSSQTDSKTVTVSENTETAQISGYTLSSVTGNNSTVTLSPANLNGTANVTNAYVQNQDITVTKTVSGNFGDKSKEFTFTYKLGDGETVNQTLKNGDRFTIENVPVGTVITITETGASGYTTTATYGNTAVDVTNGTATAEGTKSFTVTTAAGATDIAVTNAKDVVPDTGIFTDSTPYIIMLSIAAAGVGAWLVLKRKGNA